MTSNITKAIRSRWLAVITHGALWLLLYLAVMSFRGSPPPMHEGESVNNRIEKTAPVDKAEQLLAMKNWPQLTNLTNSVNPFFTRHFIPPPAQPPPAPTTKKIELVYLGFYTSDGSKRQAMAQLATNFLVAPVGSKVTADLFVADASFMTLTLTNSTSQTNILTLNVKKELEVPIQ